MKLARRITSIDESGTLAVTEKAAQLRAQGIDVVSLSAGEPDFDTPQNIKDAAAAALKKGFTKYTAASGIPELKRAVAEKFQRDNGLTYDPSQIVISCGCKHSIYNALMVVLEEGDECVIPAPYWTSYPDMVKLTGARPMIVQTQESSGFKMSAEALDRAVTPRTRMLILCSPCNPTGIVYTADELRAIAEVCAKRDILILSDEVYEKLVYDGATHTSIARFAYDRTIVVNSVSKTYAMTGWRIGYLAGPREIARAASKLQSQATSNPTSIAQYASVEALRGDQSSIAKMVQEYRRRRDYVHQRLNGMPGVSCLKPDGAFYVFPNVSRLYGRSRGGRPVTDSFSLSTLLLEQAHVALVAGAAFGSDQHLRISYATSMEQLQKAMDRMEQFFASLQ